MFHDSMMSTDIQSNDPGLPGGFCLNDNCPNPLDPKTTLGYTLFRQPHDRACVHNLPGQEVRRSVEDVVSAGEHSVMWDGRDSHGYTAKAVFIHICFMTDTFLESMQATLVE